MLIEERNNSTHSLRLFLSQGGPLKIHYLNLTWIPSKRNATVDSIKAGRVGNKM
ncbi:hypothetical protein J5TS2_29130 [Brevibacillus halotolerans]|nr:hypothetical protein J5TS2_29130 [Brevibacillus halotolerans]